MEPGLLIVLVRIVGDGEVMAELAAARVADLGLALALAALERR